MAMIQLMDSEELVRYSVPIRTIRIGRKHQEAEVAPSGSHPER